MANKPKTWNFRPIILTAVVSAVVSGLVALAVSYSVESWKLGHRRDQAQIALRLSLRAELAAQLDLLDIEAERVLEAVNNHERPSRYIVHYPRTVFETSSDRLADLENETLIYYMAHNYSMLEIISAMARDLRDESGDNCRSRLHNYADLVWAVYDFSLTLFNILGAHEVDFRDLSGIDPLGVDCWANDARIDSVCEYLDRIAEDADALQ